jgi:rare lipoprotein A
MRPEQWRQLAAGVVLLSLAACASRGVKDSAPAGSVAIPDVPGSAVPHPESPSRYGNGPVYEVLGQRYTVLPSSNGYHERGVASWYGQKFHGRLTSNRETYDMYAMTAAHKTLPLPTYARVRNLRNNKSVIVRVNDRGPFVHNRIIDLSYGAALKLDMIGDGTSLVEVTALTAAEPAGDVATRQMMAASDRPDSVAVSSPARSFVQVGAFGNRENADRVPK